MILPGLILLCCCMGWSLGGSVVDWEALPQGWEDRQLPQGWGRDDISPQGETGYKWIQHQQEEEPLEYPDVYRMLLAVKNGNNDLTRNDLLTSALTLRSSGTAIKRQSKKAKPCYWSLVSCYKKKRDVHEAVRREQQLRQQHRASKQRR